MKRLLCLAIALSLSLLLIGAPVSADPSTLYVDDDGLCGGNSPCYTTIQAAINAASPGDTIIVAPGTYNESLTINKTLMLLGAQANVDPRPSVGGRSGLESIVIGTGSTHDLYITGAEVIVNGFTFASKIGSSSYNVVYAYGAKNPQILYNIVYNTNSTGNCNEGIKVRANGDTGALVAYNYVYNIPSPGDAINLDGVNGGLISHNEVSNIGSENAAIYVYGSLSTTIKCNLVDTTTQNDGIKLGSKSGSDATKRGGSIIGNTVRNTKQDGISVYMSDVTVEANEVTGSTSENGAIYVAWGVSNVTIRDNKVHHNTLNTGKWGNPGAIMIGTAVNASTVHVNNNNIYANSPYGLTNKATASLDAKNNWWGDASGPSGAGSGFGDAVSANVDFDPWLQAPQIIADPCAPPPPDSQGPITTDVVANPNPVAVGSSVFLNANVDDSTTGGSNIASAEYSLGDGAWQPMAAQDGSFDQASEVVTASFVAPSAPGIYNLCVRGTDAAGNTGEAECIMLVVYDPNGGFVTGGGWITSPAGASTLYPEATGKATFGFVSKYQKGAKVPTGNTEFQFKAGNLNFKSTSYDWLVVAGARAQYKGTGMINGAGDYGFMLTAVDGQINGGGGVDKFRIKIWDKATGNIIYDNQMGDADTAGPTTAIGGGSIVIHK